jgi:hypothetical protein
MTKIYCEANFCKHWKGGVCQRENTCFYLVKTKFGKQVNCSHITKAEENRRKNIGD